MYSTRIESYLPDFSSSQNILTTHPRNNSIRKQEISDMEKNKQSICAIGVSLFRTEKKKCDQYSLQVKNKQESIIQRSEETISSTENSDHLEKLKSNQNKSIFKDDVSHSKDQSFCTLDGNHHSPIIKDKDDVLDTYASKPMLQRESEKNGKER